MDTVKVWFMNYDLSMDISSVSNASFSRSVTPSKSSSDRLKNIVQFRKSYNKTKMILNVV